MNNKLLDAVSQLEKDYAQINNYFRTFLQIGYINQPGYFILSLSFRKDYDTLKDLARTLLGDSYAREDISITLADLTNLISENIALYEDNQVVFDQMRFSKKSQQAIEKNQQLYQKFENDSNFKNNNYELFEEIEMKHIRDKFINRNSISAIYKISKDLEKSIINFHKPLLPTKPIKPISNKYASDSDLYSIWQTKLPEEYRKSSYEKLIKLLKTPHGLLGDRPLIVQNNDSITPVDIDHMFMYWAALIMRLKDLGFINMRSAPKLAVIFNATFNLGAKESIFKTSKLLKAASDPKYFQLFADWFQHS